MHYHLWQFPAQFSSKQLCIFACVCRMWRPSSLTPSTAPSTLLEESKFSSRSSLSWTTGNPMTALWRRPSGEYWPSRPQIHRATFTIATLRVHVSFFLSNCRLILNYNLSYALYIYKIIFYLYFWYTALFYPRLTYRDYNHSKVWGFFFLRESKLLFSNSKAIYNATKDFSLNAILFKICVHQRIMKHKYITVSTKTLSSTTLF